jgi:hypothetical protein
MAAFLVSITIYCHVYEWLQTGFGLVIGFVEHSQIYTTSKYNTIANSHTLHFTTTWTKSTLHFTTTRLSLLSLLCLHQSLPGSGFQQLMFSLLWVPKLSPCLSYQLLTATAHKDSTAALL